MSCAQLQEIRNRFKCTRDIHTYLTDHCKYLLLIDCLDYLNMAKFFKGLAQSGVWCCFDEFNRILLEVLSVVAHQVLTILEAIRKKEKSVNFMGDMIRVEKDTGLFITMNPGRSELPGNLKPYSDQSQ